MECCNEIQAGFVGVLFVLNVKDCDGRPLDMSEATSLSMVFKPPTGASFSRTAEAGPEIGELVYRSLSAEFTAIGTWRVQGVAAFTDGTAGRTAITRFQVLANL